MACCAGMNMEQETTLSRLVALGISFAYIAFLVLVAVEMFN